MQELKKIYADESSERRALCDIVEALPRPKGGEALEEIIDLLCHARGKSRNEVSFRTVGPPCLPACEFYLVLSHQVQSQSNFKFSNAVQLSLARCPRSASKSFAPSLDPWKGPQPQQLSSGCSTAIFIGRAKRQASRSFA